MTDLEREITRFKQEKEQKYSTSSKNYVYLRLSNMNKELATYKAQVEDTIKKLDSDLKKLLSKYPELETNGFKLFVEIGSAYKNSVREIFIDLCENHLMPEIESITDILENRKIGKKKNLYIADYDRLSRVFFYGLVFQIIRKLRNINVWTLNEDQRNFEEANLDIQEKDNMSQNMFVFQLMMFSSASAQHSETMSNKIKNRVGKEKGKTISTKSGKRWGTPQTISADMQNKIKKYYKRFTAKQIAEFKDVYHDLDKNKPEISEYTIYKIIKK